MVLVDGRYRCPTCEQVTDDVAIRRSGRHASECRPCGRERSRRRYLLNADDYKRRAKEYASAHPEARRRWLATSDRRPEAARRHAERQAARRARSGRVLDRRLVFDLNLGFCGICLEPVNPSDWHLDHIIPLSRGGDHSYLNTQPTHPACNLSKGARYE